MSTNRTNTTTTTKANKTATTAKVNKTAKKVELTAKDKSALALISKVKGNAVEQVQQATGLTLKSAELAAASVSLGNMFKSLAEQTYNIGITLMYVQAHKVYKQDFKTFADYVEQIFGIKRATAYSYMNTAKKCYTADGSTFDGEEWTTGQLQLLSNIPDADTPEAINEFVKDNNINTSMSYKDIKTAIDSTKKPSDKTSPVIDEKFAPLSKSDVDKIIAIGKAHGVEEEFCTALIKALADRAKMNNK